MVDKYKISAFRKTDMVTDQVVKVPALRHLINFYHTLEKITYQYKQSIPNKTTQHSGVAEKNGRFSLFGTQETQRKTRFVDGIKNDPYFVTKISPLECALHKFRYLYQNLNTIIHNHFMILDIGS